MTALQASRDRRVDPLWDRQLASATKEVDLLWGDQEPSRRALLIAGLASFATYGYHGTTTRDIARAAGMSPGALYIYFPTKATLLFELCDRGTAAYVRVLQKERASREERPEAALRGLIGASVHWHTSLHCLAKVLNYEINALDSADFGRIAIGRRKVESIILDLLREGQSSGDFEIADPDGALMALVSLCIDVARWFPTRPNWTADDLAVLYGDFALRLVGARP
jgi:AcrR family transcriptional regulator